MQGLSKSVCDLLQDDESLLPPQKPICQLELFLSHLENVAYVLIKQLVSITGLQHVRDVR
jgi:hypothetical protein